MKTIKEIYAEIQKCSSYQYFDITYKGKNDWELIKDTIKLIDYNENSIVVGGIGFQLTIPLNKIDYISEPNDIVLRYRLKSEYLSRSAIVNHCLQNDDDKSDKYFENKGISNFIFNGLVKLLGNEEKALAFLQA